MKKRRGKLLCFIIVGMMVAAVLGGCSNAAAGGDKEASSQTGTAPDSVGDTTTGPGYTVSGNIWGQGVNALDMISNEAEYVCETLGNTYKVYNDNFTADTQGTNIQSMVSAGTDGIMVFGSVPTLYSTLSETCAGARIPFVIYDQIPTDENILKMLAKNEYYVGSVGTDNYAAGSNMAKSMLEAGIKSAVILGGAVGDPVHDARVKGFTEALEAGGGSALGAGRCDSPADAATKGDDLIAAYPDAQGIYALTGDFAIGALTALSNHNAAIPVYCSDTTQEAIQYIKSGEIAKGDGGSKIATTLAALLLDNYLVGNVIRDPEGSAPYFNTIVPFIITADNAEDYAGYFLTGHPLGKEALDSLSGEGVTYQSFVDFISNYSLDFIKEQ